MRRSKFEQIVDLLNGIQQYSGKRSFSRICAFAGLNITVAVELLELLNDKGMVDVEQKKGGIYRRKCVFLTEKGREWLRHANQVLEVVEG